MKRSEFQNLKCGATPHKSNDTPLRRMLNGSFDKQLKKKFNDLRRGAALDFVRKRNKAS